MDLDDFGRRHLEAGARSRGVAMDELVGRAALYCLAARDSGRIAARVPAFRRLSRIGKRSDGRGRVSLTLDLTNEDWRALEEESRLRGVALPVLLQHALLCLLADLDANGAG